MEEMIFIMNNLRNDRIDGWDRMILPRHAKVPRTSFLNARSLTIDKSDDNKEYPDIKDMVDAIWP